MFKKIKILFLGPVPPPFMGPSIATEIILKSKLNKLFQLIHLDTSDHRELTFLSKIDLKNILLAIRHYILMIFLIITKLPKIVYIPISQTTIGYIRDSGFILIAKIFRRKVVCHLRGGNFSNWYAGASFLTRFYVRSIHRLVDGQIVLGENLRYIFAGLVSNQNIFVVPNGRNFVNETKKNSEGGIIKVLYLGNFIPTKGVIETLQSIPYVYEKNQNVEYTFIGSKRNEIVEREIESFINAHPDLKISIKGPVVGQEKYNILAESDIFVFPTYYPPEGHPWVIVEAMGSGLPIISTNQGAITESVIDGFNGFIVEKRNPEQIAEKVIQLANDHELREKMGRNSRRLHAEKFTEDKMVSNLADCFNRVLNIYDGTVQHKDLKNKRWKNYCLDKKRIACRIKNVHLLLEGEEKYSNILDIGCGTGEILAAISERYNAKINGVDISYKMVQYCKSKYKDTSYIFAEGDIRHLNFPDNQFDLVLSLSVIEWIDNYEKAVQEVARILKQGGKWIVSLPNWRSPFRKMEYFRSLFFNKSYLNYQRNRVRLNKFEKTAKKNGLELEKSKYHILPIFDTQINGKIGKWLHMMCMMSFKKNGEEHETTNAKT